MSEAEQIANALTPAQQKAITRAFWSTVFGCYHVPLTTNAKVGAALFEKKLMRRPPGWKLNSKGEAVRRYLLAQEAK